MSRKVTEESIRRRQADCDRVRFLLDHWWNGNQSRMADDLGVSQSLISKIVRATQGPGRDFLALLSRQPGINPVWVLHAEGEPLLSPTRGTLPVSPVVLPGPPLTCPHLLSGSRHMVAEALDRDTRYWLQVQESWPMVRVPTWNLSPGDLLLMETTKDWTGRLDLALGRFCGVRVRPQSPTPYEIGRLEREGDCVVLKTGDMDARLVTPPAAAEPSTPSPATPIGERSKRKVLNMERQREQAAERRKRKEEMKRQQQERQEQAQVGDTFTVDDIVAVCLYLARPMLASV